MDNSRFASILLLIFVCFGLSAQNYKADRLKRAVDVLELNISPDILLPDTTIVLMAKDSRAICLRTDPMGDVEHVGIPLFNEVMRLLQPSPVYDFLEYAVLNWKYKISPNQLYLSKVIFKTGGWDTLLNEQLNECDCSIDNKEDKLYVVSWRCNDLDVAVVGIPVDYELLNNDTRRNMERAFIKELCAYEPTIIRPQPTVVSEQDLSIYGTEGLFVVPGRSYIIDLLNQNVYYKLSTVYETSDTIIKNEPVSMKVEGVLPVVVNETDFPSESLANMMMCDDTSIPDVTMDLDFHLSNYHREHVTLPMSKLKAFCRQKGCDFFFASEGVQNENVRGILFISNLPKGYNHLLSIRFPTDQFMSMSPKVKADVYLYIPPIDKEKLFGNSPIQKSGFNLNLP